MRTLLAKAKSTEGMQQTLLKQAELSQIVGELRSHDDYIVCGHVNPDGDSIGSVLGMSHLLKAMGKSVQPIFATGSQIDEALMSLPGASSLISAEDAKPASCFITVDASGLDRLGDDAADLRRQASFTMVLDHHEVSSCDADICRIEPDCPSASCIIWDVVKESGVAPSKDMAACCYVGLMTDTGRFQYQNADTRAFAEASEMVAAGADVAKLSAAFFQNKSVASVMIDALTALNMTFICDGQAVISWITAADMERLGATKDDCEDAINVLRSISGIRVACVLKENPDRIRGSFRAKDGTDVAAIAASFGGGGHKAAAGFTLHGSLDEARSDVVSALEAALS
ncbi:MAG: bifunctional oligoribonuclease/PAP phosphatase NrnA [Eggerthellaceae bacterium]|nr:bifunctional oligoribonuclease/PAP phosphatase NrnA [Eggerthellaceae bacterium]